TGNSAGDTIVWLSIALIVILLFGANYMRLREKVFSWGILFFFVMLLPTSNLFITIRSIMAERFMYLSSIGFCAAATILLLRISEKLRLRWVLPILVICLLGIRSYARNFDWQDNLAFWKSVLAASPE